MKLPYIKNYVEDLELLLKTLSAEHFKLLFELLVTIAKDDAPEISIPQEVLYPFEEQKRKLLRMKASYENKCETNAINGAKGGKAKAAKQSGKHGQEVKKEETRTPMTKTAFVANAKDVLRQYGDGGENMPLCRFNEEDIKKAYEEFQNDKWIYAGCRIETEENLMGCFLAYAVIDDFQQIAEEIVEAFSGMTPLFSPEHFANIFLSYNKYMKAYDLSEFGGSTYRDVQKAVDFYVTNIIYKNLANATET